jgi:hypothetical protein
MHFPHPIPSAYERFAQLPVQIAVYDSPAVAPSDSESGLDFWRPGDRGQTGRSLIFSVGDGSSVSHEASRDDVTGGELGCAGRV